MNQVTIWDDNPPLKINKPIRLIELFAGYGSQALALKYLGANFEHWRICEWAYKSIIAYKDLHMPDDTTDYSAEKTKKEIAVQLAELGISANYNEPMSLAQVQRMPEPKLRQIYNAITATHNLVNISQAKASDLRIENTDKYTYIMSLSFPCQDLSNAGQRKGMSRDSGTRSGLLWEVERILNECGGNLPQVLLMENVPQVHGSKNIADFRKWIAFLDSKGYTSVWADMNAKDYGIPQNRNRCFMVSFLGSYRYSFPKPRQLTARLSDLLETNVDDSYFLSEQTVASYVEYTQRNAERGNGFAFDPFERLQAVNVERERERESLSAARALTTRPQSRATGNFILEPSTLTDGVQEQSRHNTLETDAPISADKTVSEPRVYGCVLGVSESFTNMPLAETARTVRASHGGEVMLND